MLYTTHCLYPFKITFEKPKKTSNEKIVIASMFNTWHAIASQLCPKKNHPQDPDQEAYFLKDTYEGIKLMEMDDVHLHCYQCPTGTKFLLVSEPSHDSSDQVKNLLLRIYQIYSDYALKDPFYTLEMPIKSGKFEACLKHVVQQMKRGTLQLVQ